MKIYGVGGFEQTKTVVNRYQSEAPEDNCGVSAVGWVGICAVIFMFNQTTVHCSVEVGLCCRWVVTAKNTKQILEWSCFSILHFRSSFSFVQNVPSSLCV